MKLLCCLWEAVVRSFWAVVAGVGGGRGAAVAEVTKFMFTNGAASIEIVSVAIIAFLKTSFETVPTGTEIPDYLKGSSNIQLHRIIIYK